MIIQLLSEAKQEKYYNEILEMLYKADSEFVPPLSARSSATQSNLSGIKKISDGVLNYFESLKKQRFIVACRDGELLGFVSFRENYVSDKIKSNDLPNIYVSTLIVKPEGRGNGLTKRMYQELFDAYQTSNIFTRTWSSNTAHIKILSSFDFNVFTVLENDRGAGIDTVYFKKNRTTEKME